MQTRKTPSRQPETFTDTDGVARCRVPLARGGYAVLDLEDMHAIAAARITWNWYANRHGYVVTNVPRQGVCSVARLIVGAGDGERVTFADGDKLNLRRANLRVNEGREPRVDFAAFMARQAAARKAATGEAQ